MKNQYFGSLQKHYKQTNQAQAMRTNRSPKDKASLINESSPIRLKDGLYLGTKSFCKDIPFITSHKVTHIVKAVSGEYQKSLKMYSQHQVSYLEVCVPPKDVDIAQKSIQKIYHFIEEAASQGQSVLLCSSNAKHIGKSIAILYFMRKFRWSLDKCVMFMDRIIGAQRQKGCKSQIKSQVNEFESELRIAEKFLEESDKGRRMSISWENNTDEQIDVANMYKNVVSVSIEQSPIRTGKKRVSWAMDSKVSYSGQSQNSSKTCRQASFTLTPILKSSPAQFQQCAGKSLETLKVTQIPVKQFEPNNIIKSLKNNHLRLSANNYLPSAPSTFVSMSTPMKVKNSIYQNPSPQAHNPSQSPFAYTSSPSINKRRTRSQSKRQQQRRQSHSGSKIVPYQNIISSMKSPYDQSTVSLARPTMNQFMFSSQQKQKFRSNSLQRKPILFAFRQSPNQNEKSNWKSVNSRTTVNIMKYYNSSFGDYRK